MQARLHASSIFKEIGDKDALAKTHSKFPRHWVDVHKTIYYVSPLSGSHTAGYRPKLV